MGDKDIRIYDFEKLMEEKREQVKALKTFINNINSKPANPTGFKKEKETEQIQRQWSNTKKFLEIHKFWIKNKLYLQGISERHNGNLPLSDEELTVEIYDYLELCDMFWYNITISGMALYLGIGQESEQFQSICKMFESLHESKLQESTNNANLMFLMKHRYKWNDKILIETSNNAQSVKGVVERVIEENRAISAGDPDANPSP